jgi:hypothetical protein
VVPRRLRLTAPPTSLSWFASDSPATSLRWLKFEITGLPLKNSLVGEVRKLMEVGEVGELGRRGGLRIALGVRIIILGSPSRMRP